VTSTFRFGHQGDEEPIATYAAIGFFRSSFGYMWDQVTKKGLRGRVLDESAVLAAFLTAASLLVSAIGAYWAAMNGGRHRDEGTVFADVFGRY